jgi:O-glycosyl hydrolase
MKPLIKSLTILVFSFLPFTSSRAQTGEIIEILTHPGIHYQTMDGFGASDAWRAQFVGKNWPLELRNQIADLLFSQEMDADGNPLGIGLSIWRFNITAGTAEQGVYSGIQNEWRRGECFQNSDGSYDWSKQEGQQWFLHAAKERGVERLLAFPNAPPVHLSANGLGYASEDQENMNLKPGGMILYAEFLADVMEHFHQEGFFFDYLSPVNEPQWDWSNGSQEGTPALNEEVYSLVRYLSAELSTRDLPTKIVIGEAGTIGHAAISMKTIGQDGEGRDDQARFFFSKSSPYYIGDLPNVEGTLSAHSYHSVWPIENQVQYRQFVAENIREANPDLGYWMSEYCILQENGEIGRGGGRDLGMATALYVARIIHHDLTITHAKSWQWWTAITEVDYKDGLVYLDDGSEGDSGKMGAHIQSLQSDGAVRESKLLWVLGNYSRFIRPGMVRIQCELTSEQSPVNGLLVSAYQDLEKGPLIYVLTNLSEQASTVSMGGSEQVRCYTTDHDSDMEYSIQRTDKIVIPERSVVTILK